MPTPIVKAVGDVVEKWAQRVGVSGDEYAKRATAAANVWQAAAKAGENNWKTATAAAAGRGAYGKGIDRATSAKFSRGVTDKGAARFGPGAAAARPDFQTGIGPVLDVIKATDLPARGPKGVGNIGRVTPIVAALRRFAEAR